jgi:hypothetical protein
MPTLAPAAIPPLQMSCAVCERLHVPLHLDVSNPVCVACARDHLPQGFSPVAGRPGRDRDPDRA